MDEQRNAQQVTPKKEIPIAKSVLVTLFLGAVGSGIWEVLFKPGLSTVGILMASGSTWFENEIYRTAALDPQPLPGLILLLALCATPFYFAIGFVHKGFVELPLKRIVKKHFAKTKEQAKDNEELERILGRKLKGVALIGIALCMFLGSMTFVGFVLHSEATKVWRIFQANLEICAPSLTDSEIRLTRAQFRKIHTKTDFSRVKSELDQASRRSGITLDWYGI